MRKLHINARDYQEPFHLMQISRVVENGISLDKPIRNILVFGSILNRDTLINNNQISDDVSKLSIKIVNQKIGIKPNDRVKYNSSQYIVTSVNRNYYNNGEIIILCDFEKELDELQSLNALISFQMVS